MSGNNGDDNAREQWRGQRQETMARTTPENNGEDNARDDGEDNARDDGEDNARE